MTTIEELFRLHFCHAFVNFTLNEECIWIYSCLTANNLSTYISLHGHKMP